MTLRGFLVSIHCPSEELLTVTVDCSQLSPGTYMQLVSQLQDLLSSIDEAISRLSPSEFVSARVESPSR
jgi:hypothetical protein